MSRRVFTDRAMSPARARSSPSNAAALALVRIGAHLGERIHEERTRRRMTLDQLAERSGVSPSAIHAIEAGRPASVDTYARLSIALALRPEFDLVDPRAPHAPHARPSLEVDIVHAAMGEAEARHLAALGRAVAVDEPYQHFQFAGRADVLAWDLEGPHLIHIENRTRFPEVQAVAASYNANAPTSRMRLGAGLEFVAGRACRTSWSRSGRPRCSTRCASGRRPSGRSARIQPSRSRHGGPARLHNPEPPRPSCCSTRCRVSGPLGADSLIWKRR